MKVGEAYIVRYGELVVIVGVAHRVEKDLVVGWEIMTNQAGELKSISEGWRDPKDCIPLVPAVRSDDPSIIALAEVERAERANEVATEPSIPLWMPEEEAELLDRKPEVQG